MSVSFCTPGSRCLIGNLRRRFRGGCPRAYFSTCFCKVALQVRSKESAVTISQYADGAPVGLLPLHIIKLSNSANHSREAPPYLCRASYLRVPPEVKAQAKSVETDRTRLTGIILARGTKV